MNPYGSIPHSLLHSLLTQYHVACCGVVYILPLDCRAAGRGGRSLATVLIIGVLLLAGYGEEVKPNPQEITANTFCALDGMLLLDYPGSKAQIHYDQGSPEFFCDTVEMFAIYLEPEQKKRVVAIYTQDYG